MVLGHFHSPSFYLPDFLLLSNTGSKEQKKEAQFCSRGPSSRVSSNKGEREGEEEQERKEPPACLPPLPTFPQQALDGRAEKSGPFMAYWLTPIPFPMCSAFSQWLQQLKEDDKETLPCIHLPSPT